MEYTYEVLENGYIVRSDGWTIPNDESNADYLRYLEDEAEAK